MENQLANRAKIFSKIKSLLNRSVKGHSLFTFARK
jgi:hypothetical protein